MPLTESEVACREWGTPGGKYHRSPGPCVRSVRGRPDAERIDTHDGGEVVLAVGVDGADLGVALDAGEHRPERADAERLTSSTYAHFKGKARTCQ